MSLKLLNDEVQLVLDLYEQSFVRRSGLSGSLIDTCLQLTEHSFKVFECLHFSSSVGGVSTQNTEDVAGVTLDLLETLLDLIKIGLDGQQNISDVVVAGGSCTDWKILGDQSRLKSIDLVTQFRNSSSESKVHRILQIGQSFHCFGLEISEVSVALVNLVTLALKSLLTRLQVFLIFATATRKVEGLSLTHFSNITLRGMTGRTDFHSTRLLTKSRSKGHSSYTS